MPQPRPTSGRRRSKPEVGEGGGRPRFASFRIVDCQTTNALDFHSEERLGVYSPWRKLEGRFCRARMARTEVSATTGSREVSDESAHVSDHHRQEFGPG